MDPIEALVLDMDDTLYPEQAYVVSGFRAVAAWLLRETGLPTAETYDALWAAQGSERRGFVFDALLQARPSLAGRITVADLVQAYRTHQPAIQLYEGMTHLLDEARARGLRIGMISDGHLASQTLKAEALGMARWADPIILTDAWGRDYWKPHPRAFQAMETAFDLDGPSLTYIGDNPAKDFLAPNQRGWRTIQVHHPGQVHPVPQHLPPEAAPNHHVFSVEALRHLLFTT